MHFGNLLRPPAHDLDADPARPRLELLSTHGHAIDPRMEEDKCGNSFGERFDQGNMFLRDDHSDRIRDQIVGDNVPHVFGYVLRSKDGNIDIESDLLRIVAFVRIGADTDRQFKIAHENPVGLGIILLRIERIAARGEQPIINFRQWPHPGLDPARFRWDQPADNVERMRIKNRCPVFIGTKRSTEAEDIRRCQ